MKKNFLVITFIFSVGLLRSANQFALASNFSNRDSTQQKSNHYLTLLPALAWNSYKDEINSPLTYRTVGLLPAFELGLENRGINHNGTTNIFLTNQKMNTAEAPYTDAPPERFLTFKFNTSRCYELASFWKDRIHYRLGYDGNFEYNHQINLRLENAAYTFAIWANAGIANRFELPFTIKTEKKFAFIHFRNPEQHFLLNWQVNLPLAGLITRPNFAGIRHFANGEFLSNLFREMNDHVQFVSLNKFIMIHSRLELQATLGNNNRLKIAYVWEGFRYNQDFKRVQGVMGAIEVGVAFKFDSNPEVKFWPRHVHGPIYIVPRY